LKEERKRGNGERDTGDEAGASLAMGMVWVRVRVEKFFRKNFSVRNFCIFADYF